MRMKGKGTATWEHLEVTETWAELKFGATENKNSGDLSSTSWMLKIKNL